MALKYLASRSSFMQQGPLNVVNEDHVGYHDDTLTYPSVSSCTTITFRLASKRVLGIHLTLATPLDNVHAMIDRINADKKGNITDICFVGHLTMTGSGWGSEVAYKWPRLASTMKADAGAYGARIHYRKLSKGRDVRVEALGSGGFACVTRAPGQINDAWDSKKLTVA